MVNISIQNILRAYNSKTIISSPKRLIAKSNFSSCTSYNDTPTALNYFDIQGISHLSKAGFLPHVFHAQSIQHLLISYALHHPGKVPGAVYPVYSFFNFISPTHHVFIGTFFKECRTTIYHYRIKPLFPFYARFSPSFHVIS